jgi:hypothetical protein
MTLGGMVLTLASTTLWITPSLWGQSEQDRLIAQLSDSGTREAAVSEIVAAGHDKVPLLLSWTSRPPDVINPLRMFQLKIAMAEVFGQLKVLEAVPFLIDNLNLQAIPASNIWTKNPDAIMSRLPAVAALISIGRGARPALFEAFNKPSMPDDRLAMTFVLSRTAQTPAEVKETKDFFNSIIQGMRLERFWIDEGLREFGSLGR